MNIAQNRARKNIIIGGAVILACVTLLSCVSSFAIYRDGFADIPHPFDKLLSFFAVCVVEGAFVWLVYGFTRAFTSWIERAIAGGGIVFLMAVMLINLVTHFMMVKRIELSAFQHAWLQWGAITVMVAVLALALVITLADPVVRLARLELRYEGKEKETLINAKTASLDSDKLQKAMAARSDWEADQLATRMLPSLPSKPQPGFARNAENDDPKAHR